MDSIAKSIKREVAIAPGYYARDNREKELRNAIKAVKMLSKNFMWDEFTTALDIVYRNADELL